MPAPLNSPVYAQLRALLIEAREEAGLTQAEVAKRLRRVQSFVSKYELGERRLDVVDFIAVCDCLGVDPADLLRQVRRSKR
ncbi:helix-turn-helix transcriptional regulator [Dokdonella sp.]|uniref:helix-turn-helix domain-containing protein n=1 Tax=Dokdonella sp. TaxID=2291710 RepID=UPI002D7E21BD|nr:helix-turn-helix transcriptional regulator [Dokdonella sp.]